MRKTNLERLLRGRPVGIFVNPFEIGASGSDLSQAACGMGPEGLGPTSRNQCDGAFFLPKVCTRWSRSGTRNKRVSRANMSIESERLRERAFQAERLSLTISDHDASKTLKSIAAQYHREADEVDLADSQATTDRP
jgi:hypothetical protein